MLRERLEDVPIYLLFVGMLQGVLTLVLLAGALPLAWTRGWSTYARIAGRVSLFSALLLLCGTVGNSAWMLLAYERWYVSADTLVDFFPFIPFGQWVLDYEFGNLRGHLLGGASLWQLQALWLCLAAAVWGLTALAYRRLAARLWSIECRSAP